MITQVVQYKNLNAEYKKLLTEVLEPERFIYIVKDNNSRVKSITTSVLASIQKTQATH